MTGAGILYGEVRPSCPSNVLYGPLRCQNVRLPAVVVTQFSQFDQSLSTCAFGGIKSQASCRLDERRALAAVDF